MAISTIFQSDEESSVSELHTLPTNERFDCVSMDHKTESLYGRTAEQIKLLSAYQEVVVAQHSKKVIIHGVAGSGKTSLVNSIRDSILQDDGYFVTGKFFQGSHRLEPHSAIAAAFSDICDLVAQSKDFNATHQKRIQEELGVDGKILKRFISNISPFLSNDMRDSWCYENDEFIDYHNELSLAQFMVACKTFLRVMASKQHPIVLFIDDIHWMDEGSTELIRVILNDANAKHLLIILSYSDEEEYSVQGLIGSLDVPIETISLSNLDVSSVHHMVTEFLGTTSTEIRSLSEVVMEKSAGNPSQVLLFLETIQRQNLLVKSERCETWSFDINDIQEVTITSGTYTDLLLRKIMNVSPVIVESTKLASVIGFSFEVQLLLAVAFSMKARDSSQLGQDEVKAYSRLIHKSLLDAVNLGLLLKASDEIFNFAHEKVQSAFYSMIPSDEKVKIHLIIGEKFFDRGSDGISMYNTAVQWNEALQLKSGCVEKLQVARINLEAAKYCHEKAAFAKAAEMLRFGLAVFDEGEVWKPKYFNVTFHTMEMLAQMELVLGNFQSCKEIVEKLMFRAKSTDMKLNLLVIGVEARISAFELDEALDTAIHALGILGMKIPRNVSAVNVLCKFLRLRLLLRNVSDEDILNLPVIEDKTLVTTIKILVLLCTYSVLKNKKHIAIYSAILAVFMTMKYGLSPYSANAFAIYGFAEVALGNCNKGYQYGCLAQNIQHRLNNKFTTCATMGFTLTGLSFWKESLHSLQPKLQIAGECGLEVSDVVFATCCILQSLVMQLFLGTNLKTLEESFRNLLERTTATGQKVLILSLTPYLQTIIKQQSIPSNWDDITLLAGEIMNEADYLRELEESGNQSFKVMIYMVKAELAEKFEYFEVAEPLYVWIEKNGRSIHLSHGLLPLWGCAGHVYYRLFLKFQKRKYLCKARMYRRRLQKVLNGGCMNAASSVAFLDALDVSVRGPAKSSEVLEVFDRSLDIISGFHHVKMKATFHEEAGYACMRHDLKSEAENHFQNALQIHESLGARAKYQWLMEKLEYVTEFKALDF